MAAAIAHAENRLAEAMTLLPGLPKSVLPAFLPVSLTGLYLKRIAEAPDAPLAVSPLRRQLTMWWTARRWGSTSPEPSSARIRFLLQAIAATAQRAPSGFRSLARGYARIMPKSNRYEPHGSPRRRSGIPAFAGMTARIGG